MCRMIFFSLAVLLCLVLTVTPGKYGIGGWLLGIGLMIFWGMAEVLILHSLIEAVDNFAISTIPIILALGLQWSIWSFIKPGLSRMYTLYSVLIFLGYLYFPCNRTKKKGLFL